MKRLSLLSAVSLLAVALNTGPATADEKPPANAKPLSELVRTIEQRADFQAFESIKFDDGVYEVEYHTKEGREKNCTSILSLARRNEWRVRVRRRRPTARTGLFRHQPQHSSRQSGPSGLWWPT